MIENDEWYWHWKQVELLFTPENDNGTRWRVSQIASVDGAGSSVDYTLLWFPEQSFRCVKKTSHWDWAWPWKSANIQLACRVLTGDERSERKNFLPGKFFNPLNNFMQWLIPVQWDETLSQLYYFNVRELSTLSMQCNMLFFIRRLCWTGLRSRISWNYRYSTTDINLQHRNLHGILINM